MDLMLVYFSFIDHNSHSSGKDNTNYHVQKRLACQSNITDYLSSSIQMCLTEGMSA